MDASLENKNIPDDDEICLPNDTLQILKEFLAHQANKNQNVDGAPLEFDEDWQLSQFWYNQETKEKVLKICENLAASGCRTFGLLSCPSLYPILKQHAFNVLLFEHDRRFEAYREDFIFYDYKNYESPELEKIKKLDVVIADPPFLSEECISKVIAIVKKLSHSRTKIIFHSGVIVEDFLTFGLSLRRCNFKPEHERNLGNEFAAFSNFDVDEILKVA